MIRPSGDVFDDHEDVALGSTGAIATLSKDGAVKRPRREFPPGIHGANPGPSHDDDEQPPKRVPRARRPQKKA